MTRLPAIFLFGVYIFCVTEKAYFPKINKNFDFLNLVCYDARCIQAFDLKKICGRLALSNVNVIKHSCSEADLEETLT